MARRNMALFHEKASIRMGLSMGLSMGRRAMDTIDLISNTERAIRLGVATSSSTSKCATCAAVSHPLTDTSHMHNAYAGRRLTATLSQAQATYIRDVTSARQGARTSYSARLGTARDGACDSSGGGGIIMCAVSLIRWADVGRAHAMPRQGNPPPRSSEG